jgi:hypothetical protein
LKGERIVESEAETSINKTPVVAPDPAAEAPSNYQTYPTPTEFPGVIPASGESRARTPFSSGESVDVAVPAIPVNRSHSGCPTCATAPNAAQQPSALAPSPVYVLGQIEPRFPKLSVEKEFAQATGRAQTKGLTDRQAMHTVLSHPGNRYLVRQLCWVLTVEGIDTYLLVPRDPTEIGLLIDALRVEPHDSDIDLVIGTRGPIARPDFCNGLTIPIVAFDQIYPFDIKTLVAALKPPHGTPAETFAPIAEEVLARIRLLSDNHGATPSHRALNYLAVRYPAIYTLTADKLFQNSALISIDVRPSPLSGTRQIVDVIFAYANRATDVVEKHFIRVDVSDEFPFLVTRLSPYFDH